MPDTAPDTPLSQKFLRIQEAIRLWEGDFVDNPNDPGGATNFGITLAVLAKWRGTEVTADDVKAMSYEEALPIFAKQYWEPIKGDDLPDPAALMTYNSAVNMGPSRGAIFLQRALSKQSLAVAIDGVIGPQTVDAAGKADQAELVARYSQLCRDFYQGLSTFNVFGKGWLNRLNAVTAAAADMAAKMPPAAAASGDTTMATTNPADPAANLSTIDTVLGGKMFAGKKTLIGAGGFAILSVIDAILNPAGAAGTTANTAADVAPWIGPAKDIALALAGAGVASKIERGLSLFAKFASALRN